MKRLLRQRILIKHKRIPKFGYNKYPKSKYYKKECKTLISQNTYVVVPAKRVEELKTITGSDNSSYVFPS